MIRAIRIALHPPPQPEVNDTGLRYTDILFGFVIRELFIRLQNWINVDRGVQWQLIVATTLVLGSWIGFRRSLNRSSYQLKFFNLPFFRFLTDQSMLILYFRIATLTPQAVPFTSDANILADDTLALVLFIFGLYVVWDLLGIWIAAAREKDNNGVYHPRYPKVISGAKGPEKGPDPQPVDFMGLLISGSIFLTLFVLRFSADYFSADQVFAILCSLLLIYRWVKEMRTSWRFQSSAK